MTENRKHRDRRKLLRRVLLGVIIFLAIFSLLVTAAFYSETVFRQVAAVARPLVPDSLQYKTVSGTLAGPVAFTGLDYKVADTRIQAELLTFDIAPFALLAGDVRLQDLQARELIVTLPPGNDQQPSSPTKPQDVIDNLKLPVSINANNMLVNGFQLKNATGETLFELRRFRAALEWTAKQVAITTLEANGPLLDANGKVLLGLADGYTSDVQLDVTWHGADFPVSGQLRAEGLPSELHVTAQATEPARATLDATLRNLLETPQWQGTLHVRQLRPEQFDKTLPAEPWSGTFHFNGDWQNTNVKAHAEGSWPPANGIALDIGADVNAQRVIMQQLDATVTAFDAVLTATGELHYADDLHYSAQGNISRFSWPGVEGFSVQDVAFNADGNAEQLKASVTALARGDTPGNVSGKLGIDGTLQFDNLLFTGDVAADDFRLDVGQLQVAIARLDGSVSGTPSNYTANAQVLAQVNQLPPASVEVHAEGNTEQLTAQVEKLQWLDGTAQGTVRLDWQDALALDAQLRGRDFELSKLDAQLDGVVGGNVSATANFGDEQPQVQLQLHSLTGSIADTRLKGSGSLQLANGRISTRGLDISAGDARLHLRDASGPGFDFSLHAPALGEFHPDLSGAVEATGHLEGDLSSPTFTIRATGTNAGWQQWQAGMLDLDATLREGGQRELSVRLQTRDLATPWMEAQEMRVDVEGTLASHDIAVNVDGAGSDAQGEMQFAASGGLHESQWQGRVRQLQFDHPATGEWQLQDEASGTITLGADETHVPSLCLQGPEGHGCLGPFDKQGGNWQAQSELKEIPVAVIAGLLPEGLDFRGTVSGRFNISSDDGGLDGRATFSLTEGGIRQLAGEGGETLLGWQSGNAHVNFDGRVATGELRIDLDGGDHIKGSGRLDVPESGSMRIDARLQASIENLQLVPSLVPELSRLCGRVTANLDVTGPVSKPRVRGQAQLHDASARLLALGTTWENVNITLTGEGRGIRASGRAESGDGYIEMKLQASDIGTGLKGEATLSGDAFKVIHTPEADVNVSPKLHVELQGNDLYIDGEVFVPFARIEPRDLSTAVQPSADQVIVNAEQDGASEQRRVHVAVTTRLGDDVRVSAFGLKARLEGKLTVAQEPQSRPIGTGRLTIVEGEYKAYGQDLTLAKGEIIYTGQPLSNPGLDIRAERTIDPDITAGVSVRGPLSNPAANVYSDPAMPETEALSYLLFGRSIEQITGEQESQVSNASLALNLGGQKLLGNVGRKLGVEEVRIDQVGDRDRASLVLGKYLSPDLYVSYGIGLFEAVNTFRVRYRISSKWTLEAVSGLKSSADVLYTIER